MARARSGITTTGHSSPLAAWIVMRLTASPASIGGRGTWASASCSCRSHLTTVKASSAPRSRSPTSSPKPRQSASLRSAPGRFAITAVYPVRWSASCSRVVGGSRRRLASRSPSTSFAASSWGSSASCTSFHHATSLLALLGEVVKETVVHGEEGAAEHGNQRQVVGRVREEAQEDDPVFGLPRLQQVAPASVHRGDAGRGEGIPVDLERRPHAGEYGYVPRPHGSGRAGGSVVHAHPLVQHLAQLARDVGRLRPLQLGLRHPPLGLHGVEPDVRGLVGRLLAMGLEVLAHLAEHGGEHGV